MDKEDSTTNHTNEHERGRCVTLKDGTDKRDEEGGKKWFFEVINALEKGDLEGFFMALFGLSEGGKKALHERCLAATLGTEPGTVDMWDLTREFATIYPDDPAMIAPLFLNLFTLEPGQAVYIPAGVLHAYIGGFGVELMAASDNVLRGGLTSKFVDIPELAKILQFKPFCPEIIYPSEEAVFRYPVACEDFALYLVRGREEFTTNNTNRTNNTNKEKRKDSDVCKRSSRMCVSAPAIGRMCLGARRAPTPSGAAICIVTEGECIVDGVAFKKGESFFTPSGEALRFAGNFSLYAACVP